jgi:GT2 family glycosyltransferase
MTASSADPRQPRKRVSAIVPTLNRREDLLEFADSLVAQTTRPDELLVVDAGEVPDMEAALRSALEGSGIDLVYRRSEAGTSLQRNIALDLCTGDFVFMFDDDCLMAPDFVERVLEAFDHPASPPVGCVLGTFDNAPRPRGWRQRYFKLFGMTHAVASDEGSMSTSGGVRWPIDPSRIVAIPVASGGRTAYRRDAIGDERFAEFLPGYTMAEDVEFSYRIARRWTVVQSPFARIFHKRAPTARVDYGDRVSRLISSRFYFFKHHIPKDPKHVAAFAWTNLGIASFYTGIGLFKAPGGDRSGTLRGVARGYRRCLDDVLGREVR